MIKNRIIDIPSTEQNKHTCPGEIPKLVKINAGWWAEGKISDDDFIKDIENLIKQGMIAIPNEFETEVTEVKEGICDALKMIKDNDVTDSLVTSLLPEIPVVGSFLSDMYENSHPEDKIGDMKNY